MQKYDVLVIGGGISGLSAALIFAKQGKKTAVAEQAGHIAPLIAGFDRKAAGKNLHYETGFHYSAAFGEKETGTLLLKELGIEVPFEPCSEDNYDEIHILNKNEVLKMPFGRIRLEKKLADFFPGEKDNIKKYLDLVENTIKKVPFLNKESTSLTPEDLLNFPDDGQTLKEVLDAHFANEELKAMLSYSYILHGTPPSKVSFAIHCCCTGLMTDSVWKIKGGAKTLVDAYEQALKKLGVDVFVNARAVKITCGESAKTVHFENGDSAECGICVSSIHPKEFIKIAPEEVYRKNSAERIKNIEETPAFFVLYGVLNENTKYKCTNMAFMDSGSYAQPLYHGDISPAYINFSDTDPQAVCVVAFIKPDEIYWDRFSQGYKEKKKDISEKIKNKLKEICPDIAGKITYCDAATPGTFKKYVNYYSGYGIMHDAGGASVLPATKVPGIFLTGQAVVTPGLLGALISSFLLYKIVERGN